MSDLKSKIPDLSELGSMASKLFKDVKASIEEIIGDYKKNHGKSCGEEACSATHAEPKPVKKTKPKAKASDDDKK